VPPLGPGVIALKIRLTPSTLHRVRLGPSGGGTTRRAVSSVVFTTCNPAGGQRTARLRPSGDRSG
jgi:hypothetical protein